MLYRRRQVPVTPGNAFFSEPGELHTTPRVSGSGTFHTLIVEPEIFREYVCEHDARVTRPAWRAIVSKMSGDLGHRAWRMFALTERTCSAMELQSTMVYLIEALVRECVDRATTGGRHVDQVDRTAEVMRECLHSEEGTLLNLEALAKRTGVSRFQALRSFKKRYGLPPHAYQLCVRIGLARRLLCEGRNVAHVAADCGFADQSHLARHFRQVLGVTPTEYSKAPPRINDKADIVSSTLGQGERRR